MVPPGHRPIHSPHSNDPEIILKGSKCIVKVNPRELMSNCFHVHELMRKTVEFVQAGVFMKTDEKLNISPKSNEDLKRLVRALRYGFLQAFRAECLASIVNDETILKKMHIFYSMISNAKFDLIVVHLLLRKKLTPFLSTKTYEGTRAYLLKLHIKDLKMKKDEIALYEIDRRSRRIAELN